MREGRGGGRPGREGKAREGGEGGREGQCYLVVIHTLKVMYECSIGT